MYWHYHHMHRCSRATSRLFWFFVGAGTATWWHVHKDHAAWHAARHCGRDRIPQHAYPAPGALPPVDPTVPIAAASAATGPQGSAAPPPAPGTMDKWERWGWGHWGRGSWPGQEPNERWDRWGWNQRPQPHPNAGAATGFGAGAGAPARPEGAWGPPMPLPPQMEPPEKDVVQQATDTITELSEATLNNLLATVESLKGKLAEHRAQREQQERELQALREAKFKQFEQWQRQQLAEDQKDDRGRRLV